MTVDGPEVDHPHVVVGDHEISRFYVEAADDRAHALDHSVDPALHVAVESVFLHVLFERLLVLLHGVPDGHVANEDQAVWLGHVTREGGKAHRLELLCHGLLGLGVCGECTLEYLQHGGLTEEGMARGDAFGLYEHTTRAADEQDPRYTVRVRDLRRSAFFALLGRQARPFARLFADTLVRVGRQNDRKGRRRSKPECASRCAPRSGVSRCALVRPRALHPRLHPFFALAFPFPRQQFFWARCKSPTGARLLAHGAARSSAHRRAQLGEPIPVGTWKPGPSE